MNLSTANRKFEEIRNSTHDSREKRSAQIDEIGKWAAGQKRSKGIEKLAHELHMFHDKLNGGSGKSGVRISID